MATKNLELNIDMNAATLGSRGRSNRRDLLIVCCCVLEQRVTKQKAHVFADKKEDTTEVKRYRRSFAE
jgi:uridine phosphorylase